LKLLQDGCELDVFSLKVGAKICTIALEPILLPFGEPFFRFITDLNTIATKFGSNIILPEIDRLTAEDREVFSILRAFALNEPLDMGKFSGTVLKSSENAESIAKMLSTEMNLRLEHESTNASLFGNQINLGATRITIERAKVNKLRETMNSFSRAKPGQSVSFSFLPLVPAKCLLIDQTDLTSHEGS
jgi:hypothetical protein